MTDQQYFNGQKVLLVDSDLEQTDKLLELMSQQGLQVIDAVNQNQVDKLCLIHHFEVFVLNRNIASSIQLPEQTNNKTLVFCHSQELMEMLKAYFVNDSLTHEADVWQDEDFLIPPDSETFQRLVNDYLSTLVQDQKVLHDHYQHNRWQQIQDISHRIKGSAANFGLSHISHLADALNGAIKQANQGQAKIHYQRLMSALSQLQVAKK